MRTMPPSPELARYLRLGMEHAGKLPKGDSEELVRLMTVRAFWSYVFSDDAGSDEELDAAEKDGMKAAEMARRLGRPDLESAALDGAESNLMARDRHGLIDMRRRIELADVVQDPWEIGDTFAMAAWMNFMQGRYREPIRYALEGIERSRQGGSAPMTHCLSWAAMGRYRLGEWRAFLTDMAEIEDALGDRRGKPPHWAARPFAAGTGVHEVPGNRQAADAYLAIISELERSERSHFAAPWTAVVMARRGHAEDGLKLLSRVENVSSTRSWRGLLLEARCE